MKLLKAGAPPGFAPPTNTLHALTRASLFSRCPARAPHAVKRIGRVSARQIEGLTSDSTVSQQEKRTTHAANQNVEVIVARAYLSLRRTPPGPITGVTVQRFCVAGVAKFP